MAIYIQFPSSLVQPYTKICSLQYFERTKRWQYHVATLHNLEDDQKNAQIGDRSSLKMSHETTM